MERGYGKKEKREKMKILEIDIKNGRKNAFY